jgi:hypothetical protein
VSLIFLSRDPGGARQMIGLYRVLTEKPPEFVGDPGLAALRERLGDWSDIRVLAREFALAVWRQAGIPAAEIDDQLDLDWQASDRLLTATSDFDDDTPQRAWRSARAAGCESHAFVDCEANVANRFRDRAGATSVPDHVYVPNALCLPGLQGIVPDERITLIPDLIPWLGLRDLAAAALGAERLRRMWQQGADKPILMFVSENVSEMAALGRDSPYSEFDCLDRLLACLRREGDIAGIEHRDWQLVIRPHPKEASGKFSAYAGQAVISRDGNSAEAILAADIIVGMRSTLLREAMEAGKPVVSLVDCGS